MVLDKVINNLLDTLSRPEPAKPVKNRVLAPTFFPSLPHTSFGIKTRRTVDLSGSHTMFLTFLDAVCSFGAQNLHMLTLYMHV
jgi:hypothetical protein